MNRIDQVVHGFTGEYGWERVVLTQSGIADLESRVEDKTCQARG